MGFIVVFLLLWQRQWRTLAVAAGVGAALAGLGVLAAGPDWPAHFFALVTCDYYRVNAIVFDGWRSLSTPGVLRHLAGPGQLWPTAVAVALTLGVLALLAADWRNMRRGDARFPLQFGAAVAATLIVSPHALFYEAGLLVLPVIFLVDRWRAPTETDTGQHGLGGRHALLLAGLAVIGIARALAPALPFEPLAVLPLIVAFLIWRELRPGRTPGRAVDLGAQVE